MPDPELLGGIENLARMEKGIPPFAPFDFAEAGPERLLSELISDFAGKLPGGLISHVWLPSEERYLQRDVSVPGGQEPAPEQLAWLLLTHLALLFAGDDPHWKVVLKRQKRGQPMSIDQRLDQLTMTQRIVSEIMELEKTMPASAAVSLLSERDGISEASIYAALARGRGCAQD